MREVDLKKELMQLYGASAKQVVAVDVPAMQLALDKLRLERFAERQPPRGSRQVENDHSPAVGMARFTDELTRIERCTA